MCYEKLFGAYSGIAAILCIALMSCAPMKQEGPARLTIDVVCNALDDERACRICRSIERNLPLADDDGRYIAKVIGKEGVTPLLWAVAVGNAKAAAMLIKCGADFRIAVSNNYTWNGIEITKGMTPIHVAASQQDISCLKSTIDVGADANVKSSGLDGATPIFSAIRYQENPREALEFLRDHGADLDYVCAYGTPAIYASVYLAKYDVSKALLELGANPRATTINGRTRLAHLLLRDPVFSRVATEDKNKNRDYHALLLWLDNNGESIDVVRKELSTGNY